MILKLFLNSHMIWMTFTKNTTQIKRRKALIVFDDTIADMFSYKKRNPVVAELFIRRYKARIFSCFYYTVLLFCAKKC